MAWIPQDLVNIRLRFRSMLTRVGCNTLQSIFTKVSFSHYLIANTNPGFFSASELTFHVPKANFPSKGLVCLKLYITYMPPYWPCSLLFWNLSLKQCTSFSVCLLIYFADIFFCPDRALFMIEICPWTSLERWNIKKKH